MSGSLEQFVESVNGTSHLRIEQDFGDGFVRLQTSEAERRQAAQDIRCTEDIVLELLRNSRDARASHIFVAMSRDGDRRHISVIDDGEGIPEAMQALVFESRVTSKLDSSHMDAWGMHGRGMALYSISVNAEDARVTVSDVGLGCAMKVETDLRKLSEKADQSSFPTFNLSGESTVQVRGPKNILRTTCEFAIDSRSQCAVYIGSPAELCSTMYYYGSATLSKIDRLFCHEPRTLPLTKRLAIASTPQHLADMASELGLSISERTARRIMDGQVLTLQPILDQIEIQAPNKPAAGRKPKRGDSRSFTLLKQDKDLLSESVKPAFKDIAERYYLEDDVEPTVQARRDRIVITVPVVKRS